MQQRDPVPAVEQDIGTAMSREQVTRRFQSKAERTIDEYIKERVEHKINIYFRKARSSRNIHLVVASTIAISAAVVPILINVADGKSTVLFWATFLSLVVTIGVALQEIFRFREHWRNYNLIEVQLRREEMLFSMKAGPYEDIKDDVLRQKEFANRVEDLIAEERRETIMMRTEKNKHDSDPGTSHNHATKS